MVNESILSKNKKYVIGVSGGPDSMALLDLIRNKGYSFVVCLVNYHKRLDSDLDYEVVKSYCDKYQIPLTYKEIFHYENGNFQAQAREMRYDFYEEISKLYQCDAVLLAHHYDDVLETILMQKNRGQEDGLWGIQASSKYHNLEVLRPVLHLRKQDLIDYCVKQQIEYRIDSSNLESDYTRNYFRNQVLVNYTKKQKEELFEEARLHNERYEALFQNCQLWLENHCVNGSFSYQEFLTFENPEALLKTYLLMYGHLPKDRISKKLILNGLSSLEKNGNVRINLPVNSLLIKEYDNVYVTRINKEESFCFVIDELTYGDFKYFKLCDDGHDRCGICLKESDFPITIRTYKRGDVMELNYGKKKLSRLFIDAKIPMHLRQKWPVVLNAKQEIILVPKIAKNKAYLLEKPTWFVIQ